MSRCVNGIAVLLVVIAPAAGLAQTAPAPGLALVQRSYAVADLVIPLERAAAQPGKDAAADVPMGERFVQLIVGTIEPTTWREGGGAGIVEFVATTKTLVVSQTEAVHQKVAALLADLRQSQDVEVQIEMRLLSVCDSCFERIGVDFNVNPSDSPQGHFAESRPRYSDEDKSTFNSLQRLASSSPNLEPAGQTFVDDRQLFTILEAVQGDQRSDIMQTPKMTLLNGQTATMSVGEQQFDGSICYAPGVTRLNSSIRITIQPVVTPDRRLIQLYLKLKEYKVESPSTTTTGAGKTVQPPKVLSQQMEKTLAIPNGQTAVLLGGRRLVEHRNEFGPPILSKVPYVNRLFKNVGYSRDTMVEFVLVTPRIVPLEGAPAPNEAAVRRGYEQMEKLCPGSRLENLTGATRGKPEASSTEASKAMLRELEPTKPHSDVVATLQKAYLQARAEGRVEEAEKLARALLAIDPNIQLQR